MSRRKQSKPRQIKRSLGDLEEGEDNLPDDLSLSGDEGGASDQDDSAECDGSSPAFMPPYSEEPRTEDSPSAPDDEEDEKGPELSAEEDEGEAEPQWDGPGRGCNLEEHSAISLAALSPTCSSCFWNSLWCCWCGTLSDKSVHCRSQNPHPGPPTPRPLSLPSNYIQEYVTALTFEYIGKTLHE
ncbi:zinc finger protein ZFPM1-like isoform X2 [Anguilla rostrata]|uniref:zinc finger protein ZFPM1-like isoform X2 n=1 Tax=Anguilla rostrata TaxID=7938 RepID=UPI0030CCA7F3